MLLQWVLFRDWHHLTQAEILRVTATCITAKKVCWFNNPTESPRRGLRCFTNMFASWFLPTHILKEKVLQADMGGFQLKYKIWEPELSPCRVLTPASLTTERTWRIFQRTKLSPLQGNSPIILDKTWHWQWHLTPGFCFGRGILHRFSPLHWFGHRVKASPCSLLVTGQVRLAAGYSNLSSFKYKEKVIHQDQLRWIPFIFVLFLYHA